MKQLQSMHDLLVDQLQDLFNAERQLEKALPKMSKAATSDELKEAIESHTQETVEQIERLEQVAKLMDVKLEGKKCAAMEGLIEEAEEALEMDATPEVMDAAIIAAAQRIEHYEIAGYGCARTFARCEGLEEVAELLEETLDEESDADDKLTEIAEEWVNQAATEREQLAGEEEESAEEEEEKPSPRRQP